MFLYYSTKRPILSSSTMPFPIATFRLDYIHKFSRG